MISEHSNLQYFVDDAGAGAAINNSSVESGIWDKVLP